MDFAYSPHRETGGTLHLPSPTHPHSYRVDGFPSIKQIRRSLSRSPSKPSRFQLHTAKPNSGSPGSPISPLALSRAFSPRAAKDGSPNHAYPPSPLAAQPPVTAKKKFTLRRTAPFRSSPRNRPASKSPRRVLSDSTNQGNATPFSTGHTAGEENTNMPITALPERQETEPKPPMMRFEINDGPIKFEFARSRESNAPGANCLVPAKSSPLKRSDGIMNLDQASLGSPVAKRRSLHGAPFGSDFDIFDHAPTPSATEQNQRGQDNEMSNYSFSSPISKTSSPLRKSLSLRKSTLSQRHGSNTPRSKPVQDQSHEFALPGPAASRTRNRMSLDSSLSFASHMPSPFRRNIQFESTRPISQQPQTSLRGGAGLHQPHPLSNALTPSSSTSSVADDSPTHAPAPAHSTGPPRNAGFSRSLPIGAMRPQAPLPDGLQHMHSENRSFETPVAYKMAKPLPAAFMSTGLISKRNRNADLPQANSFASYAMPDTPSKRVSFPPMTSTPFHRSVFGKSTQPRHEFGTPTTPFGFHPTNPSPESFGKGVNIFGTQLQNSGSNRRGSFVSIDGDENSQSPGGQIDSQSSNDELPPTPTKQGAGGGRASHSKGNSLRSSLFGRRTSLGADTFTPPTAADSPSPTHNKHARPMTASDPSDHVSPHTPQDSFAPPDPSNLSISAHGSRRGSLSFNNSTNSNASFPPATPTAPRDHTLYFGNGQPGIAPITGLTQNDVDTALTSRFNTVTQCGNGEFSQVYRVENPIGSDPNSSSLPSHSIGSVWAVKKTKRPYAGVRDRERKLREVRILQALRGHEHIVALADSWEAKNYLYIQTEFCENGNLKDFLTQTGYKGRLDDFRIWKILLELSLGVKYIHDSGFIHLDLKPANVFIDWEGVLKIGDFGLASTWPAPADIDGEGDREYIGPEVLSGRFDKPADIFALGMIMLEIAGNIILPDNGTSWQRLRAGDMSDLPSLTWSSESSLARDQSGDPVNDLSTNGSNETLCVSDGEDDTFKFLRDLAPRPHRSEELVKPPNFMVDPDDNEALDKIVQWMISPQPDERPVIDQVYRCGGVQWVEKRRRAGGTIYEGNWGPADDVLDDGHDVDMTDA